MQVLTTARVLRERALHQSREATALKLVDAVDLQGNVRDHSEGLPHVINQFCAFLLEQLSKESREATKEQQRMQVERAERARKLAAKHERDLHASAHHGALSPLPHRQARGETRARPSRGRVTGRRCRRA